MTEAQRKPAHFIPPDWGSPNLEAPAPPHPTTSRLLDIYDLHEAARDTSEHNPQTADTAFNDLAARLEYMLMTEGDEHFVSIGIEYGKLQLHWAANEDLRTRAFSLNPARKAERLASLDTAISHLLESYAILATIIESKPLYSDYFAEIDERLSTLREEKSSLELMPDGLSAPPPIRPGGVDFTYDPKLAA